MVTGVGLDPGVWVAKSDPPMGITAGQAGLGWVGLGWTLRCEWPKVTHEGPPWPGWAGLGWAELG